MSWGRHLSEWMGTLLGRCGRECPAFRLGEQGYRALWRDGENTFARTVECLSKVLRERERERGGAGGGMTAGGENMPSKPHNVARKS